MIVELGGRLVGHLVGAAETGASIFLARARDRQRVLHEAVDVPVGPRVVADLYDGIGPLTLVLCQRNENGIINALVLAVADADIPVVTDLVTNVELLSLRIDAECLLALVDFRAE